MKKLLIILMVGSLFAQNLPPQTEIEKMNASGKMLLYDMNKKTPSTAIILSVLFPSIGHLYGGKWGKGLLFTSVQGVSAILSQTMYDEKCRPNSSWASGQSCTYTQNQWGKIATVSLVVFKVWEIIDAKKVVKKYNRRIYRSIYGIEPPSISFKLQPTYQGATLTMSYSFN